MYRLIVAIALSLLMICSAQGMESPEVVSVGIAKAFIPIGFDSNDTVQVAVSGVLPNACYRVGPASVSINENDKSITIRQEAYEYSAPCLQFIIPFIKVVDIGILTPGNYTIVDEESGMKLGTVPVTTAMSTSIDDHLYAPVTDAQVIKSPNDTHPTLVLNIKWNNRCTRYKETIVHEYQDVIVVQPIAESLVRSSCDPESVRFQVTKPLSQNLKGTYLLYVRSMDGQALNKVIDID